MELKLEKFRNLISRKLLIQIYFIFFILLNIADFLDFLSGDLDFFKKLLSWALIGYMFYYVSPTKIFIGKRLKKYDIYFLIGYSFMTIVKALKLYLVSFNKNNFFIFKPILVYLSQINNLVEISFLIGLLIIIINSFIILSKYKSSEDSFVGSIKLSGFVKFLRVDILILILIQIFFALTIFNLFMEWFALAVDALILVLGLIYYLIYYIHQHTRINTTYLSNVSNTGSQFLKNIIKTFSNYKTFMVGVSLILTLHLLVDSGVFLFSYSFGTGSSLYFHALSQGGTEHIPIFNFESFTNSRFYQDIVSVLNSITFDLIDKILVILSIFLIDLISLFLFFFLFISPFYFMYNIINKNKIKLNKTISILFLTSIVFFISFNLFINSDLISNSHNNHKLFNYATIPLGLETINFQKTNINGVDIYTNSLFTNNINDKSKLNGFEVLVSILLFIIIFILIKFRYQKYRFFYEKFIYLIILSFFLIYISIFFITSLQNQIDKYVNINQNSPLNYNNLELLKDNTSNFNLNLRRELYLKNMSIHLILFSDKEKSNLNSTHNDYIYFKIDNLIPKKDLIATNSSLNIIFKENSKYYLNNKSNLYLDSENNFSSGFIILGKNIFIFNSSIRNILSKLSYQPSNNSISIFYKKNKIFTLDSSEKLIKNIKYLKQINLNSEIKTNFNSFIQLFIFIFMSIFYILGIIFFCFYYIQNIFFKKEKINLNEKIGF